MQRVLRRAIVGGRGAVLSLDRSFVRSYAQKSAKEQLKSPFSRFEKIEYEARRSGAGYTSYGHARDKPPEDDRLYKWFRVGLPLVVYVGLVTYFIDWTWFSWFAGKIKERVTAKSEPAVMATEGATSSSDAVEYQEKELPKKPGFHDRKMIEYENRIRAYSTPDKVFRYFATLKVYHSETAHTFDVYMTPEDFVRSITPGVLQPKGLGLDQFRKFDPSTDKLNLSLDEDSIFYKIGQNGIISFTDFVFLLTVLSTSPRHFAIAFKMFDVNGDGELDYPEFERVEGVIRNQTTIGSKHRDHLSTGSTLSRRPVDSALVRYFFGADKQQKLTYQRFLDFQQQLQRDILKIEFQRRDPDADGRISELAFANMCLMHSGFANERRARMRKRLKKMCKESPEKCPGVDFEELSKFFSFLNSIGDIDTALTFYHMAGASIDQTTLRHVAKTVAHVELPEHVINAVFTLFDENQDGELSNKEFVSVMKRRLLRGLEKPKDTGLLKLLNAVYKCAREKTPEHH